MSKIGGSQIIGLSVWTIIKIVLVLVGFALVWMLRDILVAVFAAILLAALIDPFAEWFSRHHIPRAVAVLIIYLLLVLLVVLVVVLLIPPLIEQTTQLAQALGLGEQLGTLLNNLKTLGISSSLGENAAQIFDTIRTVTGKFLQFVGAIVALSIVLVLAFYMVVEEEMGERLFRSLAPPEYQPYLSQLFSRIQVRVGGWLRGQLLLGLIIGLLTFAGLTILDVRYALVLAVIAGILEIVPYLGPILSAIPAVILTFVDSPVKGLIVLAFYFLLQQVENTVLVPRIMQKTTGLNPIISILALLVGAQVGQIAGVGAVVGVILAIPVALIVMVVLEDLFFDAPQKE